MINYNHLNPIDFKPVSVLKAHRAPIYVVKFNRDG